MKYFLIGGFLAPCFGISKGILAKLDPRCHGMVSQGADEKESGANAFPAQKLTQTDDSFIDVTSGTGPNRGGQLMRAAANNFGSQNPSENNRRCS